ncbi:hypothetical protein B9Z55_006251 [Caenorhabditis nigoni]|uniref:Uncharacterized protein n=1 Tax=Caenorhabditis nigoni TaxID=1611254 RepID=A0A2G5V4D9_9PELO|nr:hypothetical protein B9Z55_006251 [Caenorhabditis nigoni]
MFPSRYIHTKWRHSGPTKHSSTTSWEFLYENLSKKNYNYDNYQQNNYRCAHGACTRSRCSENSNGYGSCCCHGNYCNSGFDFSKTAVSSMILTIVSVVYMYL